MISGDALVLGRSKGFLEVYRIGENVTKRIEFCSHVPSFDYLRSTEIGEGIDSLAILPSGNKEVHVLSANAKSVKMWNVRASYVQEKSDVRIIDYCEEESADNEQMLVDHRSSIGGGEGDKNSELEEIFQRPEKKSYFVSLLRECAPENVYNIHSISASIDHECILLSDELSVVLYNAALERKMEIVNIKPQKNEELNKIISTAKFSPYESSVFVYGTSNGSLEIYDLRECIQSAPSIGIQAKGTGDFYNEIVRSVTDISFVSDTLLAARDLFSVIVHDLRAPNTLQQEHDVYPLAKKKVADLYDSDNIFSKFDMGVQNRKIYTGSFNTSVAEINTATGEVSRSFLEDKMAEATRIVDERNISCVSIKDDYLIAAVSNQCHIFRPQK